MQKDSDINTNTIKKISETTGVEYKLDRNYTQGCEFSPDGLCILTATAADRQLRLYNTLFQETSSWNAVLTCKEGDAIRDYKWYPKMSSQIPSTCFYITTSKDQPIHLYDAYRGTLCCSYKAYNHMDELTSATCLSFSSDGSRFLASGFRTESRMIKLFYIDSPGRQFTNWKLGKTRRSCDGQKGIVSCMSFADSIFAVGTYSPGTIYIYDDRVSSCVGESSILENSLCLLGHGKKYSKNFDMEDDDFLWNAKQSWFYKMARTGITQLQWSDTDPYKLYSASRKSNAILTWDIRKLSDSNKVAGGQSAFSRDGDTNQSLQFDVIDSYMFVASQDNSMKVYHISKGKLLTTLKLEDVVNGVSVKEFDIDTEVVYFISIATGARRYHKVTEDNCEDNGQHSETTHGSLQLFQIKKSALDQLASDSGV